MKCIHSYEDGDYCLKHSHGAADTHCAGEDGCPDFATKTNADRIRAMTDVELAEWILETALFRVGRTPGMVCPPNTEGMKDCPTDPCQNCWLDWLKSPEEVG